MTLTFDALIKGYWLYTSKGYQISTDRKIPIPQSLQIHINKYITNNIQHHKVLPNMYTKIQYMTWYTLNKKEEAQVPIRHKQI